MSMLQLLSGYDKMGITFEVVENRLKINAPKGILNKELIDEISERKGELLAFLQQYVYKHRDFVSIPPTEKMEYYPLSPAQKRLYIIQQMDRTNVSYNMPVVFPLPGRFEKIKIKNAFRQLIRRHESLRTSFITVDDEPVQRIHDDIIFEIEKVNSMEEFVRPFDLAQVPLVRVGLLETSPGKSLMVVDMHHIITDGTSQNLLKREFMGFYNAAGDYEILPLLRLQYRDYSQWLNSPGQQEAVKRQETYWTGLISDEPPVLTLPLDYPRPEIQSYEGGRVNFSLEPDETAALKYISGSAGATLYMMLLALYSVLLSKLSGLEDIIVGTPIAARRHEDLEPIIGMFVNTLIMRNYPAGSKTFSIFLKEVKEQTLQAYENQEYPFEELVKNVLVRRDTGRNPLFDVMFNLLNQSEYPEDIPDEKEGEETTYGFKNRTSKFDMNLTAVETGGGGRNRLFFVIEYCARLFKESSILKFVEYFKRIISRVLDDIEIELCRIDILTEAEKKRLLVDFNSTEAEFPREKTIHQLFEEQVERTPYRIALYFKDETVTYEDLNKNADILAGFLMEKGVGPDTVTGLMVGRSFRLITGILGILKAGGAYLPIDTDYPPERIRYMMKDSGAGILVSDVGEMVELGEGIEIIKPDRIGGGGIVLPAPCILHSARQLCYVIYTSGSTGKPKGVMLEHRNLVNLIVWGFRSTNLDFTSVLQFSTICFDISFQEIFSTLLSGGRLSLVHKDDRTDIPKLFRIIEKNEIRTLFLPMSMLNVIFSDNDYIKMIPVCVTHIQTAGEQVLISDAFRNFLKEKGVHLHNHYGPAETHVVTALTLVPDGDIPTLPSIGKPIFNTGIYIRDRYGNIVPPGVPGELYIDGVQVGRGYLNNPELTLERFIESNRSDLSYRTGDLARWMENGNIEFLGRIDHQVKIRGFRVEPGEIENRLINYNAVKEAVVLVKGKEIGEKYLCAYIVVNKKIETTELRQYLSERLPHFMVPAHFVILDKLPLTPTGKINRRELLNYSESSAVKPDSRAIPGTEMETLLAGIWRDVLGNETVGIHDNFFEIGGNSISILKVHSRLKKAVNVEVPVVKLFKYPTIQTCARFLEGEQKGETGFDSQLENEDRITQGKDMLKSRTAGSDIAVIGMAGIFPGAKDIYEFWENLKNGVESISFFSDDEVMNIGAPAEVLENPDFVKARGIIDGAEYFDASFFNYTPLEAEIMDPQVRIFHQCVWTALENAGYNPFSYPGRIGLYAGSSPNVNWEVLSMLSGAEGKTNSFHSFLLRSKDFMCTRIAYKLNLKGPGFNIQTACSTSLVAVHLAVQGLLNGECEMAMAGGVTISCPVKNGYIYQEGMIKSPDGHCRAFDADSRGIVGGNGAGVVVLKRLEDARGDGDHIYALIKGSAINNDGVRKVGYTAPSVEGQAEVICAAMYQAGVNPETVTYIEAHGTGTEMGDPVEVEALKMAFKSRKKNFCGIGSVKTNIGHLDTAAGVTGLIKTVLALKHRVIPPTLHFKELNPKLGLENSPFYVVSRLTQWNVPGNSTTRRAGVSSLGIGGTNAHVVLEEWQENRAPVPEDRKYQLILLSAKTPSTLEKTTANLIDHFNKNLIGPIGPIGPIIQKLPDIAYTLQTGRKHFPYRKMTVCASDDAAGVVELLSSNSRKVQTSIVRGENPPVIFMFPGQGAQYVNMGLGLYRDETVFRRELDRCFDILTPIMGYDVKSVLFAVTPPIAQQQAGAPDELNRTEITQPVLFAFEYALASLLISWGITPDALIGHSIGEYTAACLSGVISLEDSLELVALRGRLMGRMPRGAMLSISAGEKELLPRLPENLSLAAVNAPTRCVVSGTEDAVAAFNRELEPGGYECRRLHTSHAFHSAMMDPILESFKERVDNVSLNLPRIPFISNVTGKWALPEEVTDSSYWSKHIRQPVLFSQGIKELLKKESAVFVEVGPGRSLSTLVRQHKVEATDKPASIPVVNLVKHPNESLPDDYYLLQQIGELWLYGVVIDWSRFVSGEKRYRIPLPAYPFEGRRYWPDESAVYRLFGQKSHIGKVTSAPSTADSPPGSGAGAEEISREFGGPKYEAPRNNLEMNIANIWEELMGIKGIGIYDDFFRLNGDSLAATQVIARIRKLYPVELSLHDFFVEPTIEHLAETVKKILVAKVKNLSPEEKLKLSK